MTSQVELVPVRCGRYPVRFPTAMKRRVKVLSRSGNRVYGTVGEEGFAEQKLALDVGFWRLSTDDFELNRRVIWAGIRVTTMGSSEGFKSDRMARYRSTKQQRVLAKEPRAVVHSGITKLRKELGSKLAPECDPHAPSCCASLNQFLNAHPVASNELSSYRAVLVGKTAFSQEKVCPESKIRAHAPLLTCQGNTLHAIPGDTDDRSSTFKPYGKYIRPRHIVYRGARPYPGFTMPSHVVRFPTVLHGHGFRGVSEDGLEFWGSAERIGLIAGHVHVFYDTELSVWSWRLGSDTIYVGVERRPGGTRAVQVLGIMEWKRARADVELYSEEPHSQTIRKPRTCWPYGESCCGRESVVNTPGHVERPRTAWEEPTRTYRGTANASDVPVITIVHTHYLRPA
ncbi:hypothetical protein HD554DRAFT_2038651 [Boletus coccyginus]|nr:hypothetical protein HD554DRAFT_2038651 [Boletus coccyginus]